MVRYASFHIIKLCDGFLFGIALVLCGVNAALE